MTVDFTRIFSNPDELADFIMLPNDKQDRILAELPGKEDFGVEAVCDIALKQPKTRGEN